MCFVAFYYYWIYILSLTVLWHLFSKVLHQIFGPDFERNISNRIRQQRTINRLIKFGVAFNSSSREHFERTDPKTFKNDQGTVKKWSKTDFLREIASLSCSDRKKLKKTRKIQ